MIKDDILKTIAERSGIKFDDLKTAITSDTEVEITMPDKWHTFSEDELATRDRSKYNEGKTAGYEIDIKEKKNELGLEFEGKTLSNLITAAMAKATADAGVEPEAKYKELENKYTALVGVKEGLESTIASKEAEILNIGSVSQLVNAITSKGINTTIPADKIVKVYLTEHDIVDGKNVRVKGEADILKDDKTREGILSTSHVLEYANQFAVKDTTALPKDNGKEGKDRRFTSMTSYNAWKEEHKPAEDVANEVLINSAKETGPDFYDN